MNNSHKLEKILIIVSSLLPLLLIIGPAISDISIVLISSIFIFISLKDRKLFYYNNWYFIFFLIVCLFLILLSLNSENIKLSMESTLFYFRFGFFTLAIAYLVKNKNFIKYFTYCLLICFFILIFDAIIEFLFNFNFLYFINFIIEPSQGRVSSLFGNEHILGSYLVRLLPISILLILINFKNKKYFNYFFYIFVTFVSIVVFISGERTAFFMLILIIILMLLLIKNIRKNLVITILPMIFIFICLIYSNSIIKNRMIKLTFNQVISTKENSNDLNINFFSVQHEVIYKTSFKIFRDNPILGIGPKSFRNICKNSKYHSFTEEDRSINGCQTHPHNTYVQFLVETGTLGFFLITFIFLTICFQIIKSLKNINKKLNNNELIKILSLISIFVNLWPLMPNGNFFNNWLSIIFYIPVGFYFSQKIKKQL